jgi:hypothetical protein
LSSWKAYQLFNACFAPTFMCPQNCHVLPPQPFPVYGRGMATHAGNAHGCIEGYGYRFQDQNQGCEVIHWGVFLQSESELESRSFSWLKICKKILRKSILKCQWRWRAAWRGAHLSDESATCHIVHVRYRAHVQRSDPIRACEHNTT